MDSSMGGLDDDSTSTTFRMQQTEVTEHNVIICAVLVLGHR
jgi:hypothetical protein